MLYFRNKVTAKKIRRIRNNIFLRSSYFGLKEYAANIRPISFLWHIFDDRKAIALFVLLCTSLTTYFDWTLSTLFAKLVIQTIENYQGKREMIVEVLKRPLLIIIALVFFMESIGVISRLLKASKIMPFIDAKIKIIYLDRIIKNSYEYFLESEIGAINSAMYSLLHNVKYFVLQVSLYVVPNMITCALMITTIFFINKILGLIILCDLLFNLMIFKMSINAIKTLTAKTMTAHSLVASFITDVLLNVSSVILFDRKKFEMKRLKRIQNYESQRIEKLLCFMEYQKLPFIASMITSMIIFIYYCINHYISSVLSLSDIVAASSLMFLYFASIYYLQLDSFDLIDKYGTMIQSINIMNAGTIVQDSNKGMDLKITDGKIEYKEITFAYSESEDDLFEKENLIIKPKEKVGLVGQSGSGKTTFINLLLRNLELDSGKILIDNQDIALVSDKSLKDNISIISQENILFNRSVYDNILYGKLKAKREEVILAAKKANAHDFIMELESGYDTIVGERGNRLSGGQRQRINIARAILKNAPILILDEATSALDAENEKIISTSLENLMQNKTVIAIAHKLSTLQKMDRIVVLQDGEIVEHGTNEELLNNEKSLYYKLWHMQHEAILID